MRKTETKVEFWLKKKNSEDFDRNSVEQQLNIVFTDSKSPRVGNGVLNCEDLEEARKDMPGVTILSSDTPPYKMLLHAYLKLSFPRVVATSLDASSDMLMEFIRGKELQIINICKEYGLFACVIFRIYASFDNLPVISLREDVIKTLSSINVSVDFDLQLDAD